MMQKRSFCEEEDLSVGIKVGIYNAVGYIVHNIVLICFGICLFGFLLFVFCFVFVL